VLFRSCTNHPGCKASYPDDKGKPKLDKVARPAPENAHACPSCGKPLVRRASKANKGGYWWGCSGFPHCTFKAIDVGGKPKLDKVPEVSV
jgi:DNA topoisomerase-3